ncbi:DNA polymerase IV [Rubripirellula sp.]|nr:DNA polymerase IV [Rubripirellula sp.]MDB4634672.1 DNA polymerase IV [Rubripirellula sp.]
MILHIDMDAFYASIEQRDNPNLLGKPVVVGGSAKRGVVAAASYEARRFGIHSAMSGKRAAELCPQAVFVQSRLDHYADIGRQVREIFLRFTPVVQPLSLDEAFLDVAGTLRLFGSAREIGMQIKLLIQQELKLTASVGIAPLKFVAKIASDIHKPDGFTEISADDITSFLDPLPVSRLWGVGRVGNQKLASLQLKTIGDIRRYDRAIMSKKFGNWGDHLWKLANGIDPRKVVPDRTAKQISHERTFVDDIDDPDMMRAVISHLCEQVTRRLRRNRRFARSVTVKYRCDDFRTFAKTRSFNEPTQATDPVFRKAMILLKELTAQHPQPIRLLGVSVGNLTNEGSRQLDLFQSETDDQSQKAVDQVVDQLSDQLGKNSVYRATSHSWINRDGKPQSE